MLKPKSYWINTSGNDILHNLADMAAEPTRTALESLMAGETIEQYIREELTYSELYKTIDNVWSVMFLTGYLTQDGETDDGKLRLRIPNRELHELYTRQIKDWFNQKTNAQSWRVKIVIDAVVQGSARGIEENLNGLMEVMISYFDATQKEIFYHGFLLGILGQKSAWTVQSNREAGDGRSDICVRNIDRQIGYIFELKYSDAVSGLRADAEKALTQIEEKRYAASLLVEDIHQGYGFGVAFHKKYCRVAVRELVM